MNEQEFEAKFGLDPITDPAEFELASAILRENEAKVEETHRKVRSQRLTESLDHIIQSIGKPSLKT